MSHIEKTIEVAAPIPDVYRHWTSFESFPHFMRGVKEVSRLDDDRLHWRAEVAGVSEEWDAEITENEPERRVAWRSLNGPPNHGDVQLESLGDRRTRVTLRMSYEPQGAVEKVGDAVGLARLRIEGDLERFRSFVENDGEGPPVPKSDDMVGQ